MACKRILRLLEDPGGKDMRLCLFYWQFTNLSTICKTGLPAMAFGLVLAAMLLGCAPFCGAQEVDPDHFTATGVQDDYPAKSPLTKQGTTKVPTATRSIPGLSRQGDASKQKAIPDTRQVRTSETDSGPAAQTQIPSSLATSAQASSLRNHGLSTSKTQAPSQRQYSHHHPEPM
jgi:hypothetical protein